MCDFKPGDEVVCVDSFGCPELSENQSYTVERCLFAGDVFVDLDGDRVEVENGPVIWLFEGFDFRDPDEDSAGYRASRFRKVRRLDLSAWLETAATDTDRWDKPIKAPAHPDPVVTAFFARIMAGGDR